MISSFKETAGDTGGLEVYYLNMQKSNRRAYANLQKNMTWYQAWLLTDTVKNSRFLLMEDILFYKEMLAMIGKQKTGGEISQWIF